MIDKSMETVQLAIRFRKADNLSGQRIRHETEKDNCWRLLDLKGYFSVGHLTLALMSNKPMFIAPKRIFECSKTTQKEKNHWLCGYSMNKWQWIPFLSELLPCSSHRQHTFSICNTYSLSFFPRYHPCQQKLLNQMLMELYHGRSTFSIFLQLIMPC